MKPVRALAYAFRRIATLMLKADAAHRFVFIENDCEASVNRRRGPSADEGNLPMKDGVPAKVFEQAGVRRFLCNQGR